MYWNNGRCRCDHSLNCQEVGFLLSDINNERYERVKPADYETFKFVLTVEDMKRQSDETFLEYKVRLARKVFNRAEIVRTYKDVGFMPYNYNSWQDATPEDRERNFKATIKNLRTQNGSLFVEVVGCFSCGAVFKCEANVMAHVDRMRLLQDTPHTYAKMVKPDAIESVRETPTDYQGPTEPSSESDLNLHTARVGPVRPSLHRPNAIDTYERELGDLDTEYRDAFSEYIREQFETRFSGAVGCSECGKIYANAVDLREHFRFSHGYSMPSEFREFTVYMAEEPEAWDDEAEREER
jgi:uncharacterized C2H2 Zn-finger protein